MPRPNLSVLEEHNNITVLRVQHLLLGLLSLKVLLLLLQFNWNGLLLKRAYDPPFFLVLEELGERVRCELIVDAEDVVLGFEVIAHVLDDFCEFVVGELVGLFVLGEELVVEDIA